MISYDPYPVIPWEWKWTWLLCSVLRIVAVHPCCNAATCCTMTCWWKATLDLMLWRLLAEIDGFRWIPMDIDGFRWILVMPLLPNADSSCCGRSTGLSWTLPPSSRGKHAGVVPREPFWRIETYPFFGELEPRSILDHCICWMIKANSCPPRVVGGRQGEHRLESPGMPWLLHFMETYGNLF